MRYAWIRAQLGGLVVRRPPAGGTWTDRLDAVLTHRVLGLAILVLILGTVFQAIYAGATPLMDLIDGALGALRDAVGAVLPEGLVRSFCMDGVIGGVGAVIVFLPQIAILFLFLALLEDCGYLARAAFLLDRVLARMGLSGKSVMPLLSSFACAIPGIMATRTIEDRRDRLATILVAPLMSCSARFPVYALLIGAFVPAHAWLGGAVRLPGLVLLAMHGVGVLVAIPIVYLFKRTILRGASPPFVMELPPYTWPSARTVARRVADRSWAFVRRAGTLIFSVTVAVWALTYAPRPPEIHERHDEARAVAEATLTGEALAARRVALDRAEASAYLEQSLIGWMGHGIEPLVRPLGWDWRIGVAAIASFPAREVVVSTLGTIYQAGGDDEGEGLRSALHAARWPDGRPVFSLAVALSLMVFFALCAQCASTLVVIKREAGGWRWAALTFGYMTALAYVGALVTYQGARALGWG